MTIYNFGSINIDHVYRVDDFVAPGETISSKSYQRTLGGKGANQSIALARAGAKVRHIGALHRADADMKQQISDYGVDCEFVTLGDTPSGHAIIQVSDAGENAIVLFGGANQQLAMDDLSSVLHSVGDTGWFLTQNETNNIADAMALAKSKGLKVAFNPAPMTDAVKDVPAESVDLLIVNEIEAADLTGCQGVDNIIAYFNEYWPHTQVLMTLGSAGALLLKDGQQYRVDAFKVDAVDTTAAGDTFIGFFLAAISGGASAGTALKLASGASALTVTQEGAAQSIPTIEQVQAFIASQE